MTTSLHTITIVLVTGYWFSVTVALAEWLFRTNKDTDAYRDSFIY